MMHPPPPAMTLMEGEAVQVYGLPRLSYQRSTPTPSTSLNGLCGHVHDVHGKGGSALVSLLLRRANLRRCAPLYDVGDRVMVTEGRLDGLPGTVSDPLLVHSDSTIRVVVDTAGGGGGPLGAAPSGAADAAARALSQPSPSRVPVAGAAATLLPLQPPPPPPPPWSRWIRGLRLRTTRLSAGAPLASQ
eukprot:gene2428-1200_t